MCKCAWLKKLLGMKKDCCCRSAQKEPAAPSTDAVSENLSEKDSLKK